MALVAARKTPKPPEVYDCFPGPVLVLAGPGTGKTHTLAKRVKWLVEDKDVAPDQMTLITFTVEAARNMRARLSDTEKEDVYVPRDRQPRVIRTMHGLGHEIIGGQAAGCGLKEGFRIVHQSSLRRVLFEDAAQLVGRSRTDGRKADRAKQRALLREAEVRTQKIAKKYDAILRTGNAIDYDDQILLACRLLQEDEDLRAEYQAQARHLLVDEYQDINADQCEFIRLLSASSQDGLFVVGDDDQSIYGFRGGSPIFMHEFKDHFGEGARIKQLGHSWRCPSNVVNAALGVVKKFNEDRLPKRDFTFRRQDPGLVKVWSVPSDQSEADSIARIARNVDPSAGMLILVPSLEYSTRIRAALRKAGVSYELVGQPRRGGFEIFLALSDWLADPEDNLALRDLLQKIVDGGSVSVPSPRVRKDEKKEEREAALGHVAGLWKRVLSGKVSLREALESEAANGELAATLQGRLIELREAYEGSLPDFVSSACRILAPWSKPKAMLSDFRTVMEETRGGGVSGGGAAVRVMTMRMAKGLEADTTVIVGLEEGGFPSDRDDVEEAARLMYVSMTRAEAELHLFQARRRDATATFMKESFGLEPSEFLGAIPDEYCERQYIAPKSKKKKKKKKKKKSDEANVAAREDAMAETRVQLEAEDWVRREWMPKEIGGVFSRERLRVSAGGQFDFDAVSLDHKIAAVVSTNGGRTASGRPATPKLHKIRSDVLFLLMAPVKRRLVLLTDKSMHDLCIAEKEQGRMPPEVEFHHAPVPVELEERLQASRRRAAKEVTPDR